MSLLSLAEAEFFRPRWSEVILSETERAIGSIIEPQEGVETNVTARRHVDQIRNAFTDSIVEDYAIQVQSLASLPDLNDGHVIGAALKTGAVLIVTENLKDFPTRVLGLLGIEAKGADAFIADTIDLDIGRAVMAIYRMRQRFKRPELTVFTGFTTPSEKWSSTTTSTATSRCSPAWRPSAPQAIRRSAIRSPRGRDCSTGGPVGEASRQAGVWRGIDLARDLAHIPRMEYLGL